MEQNYSDLLKVKQNTKVTKNKTSVRLIFRDKDCHVVADHIEQYSLDIVKTNVQELKESGLLLLKAEKSFIW